MIYSDFTVSYLKTIWIW